MPARSSQSHSQMTSASSPSFIKTFFTWAFLVVRALRRTCRCSYAIARVSDCFDLLSVSHRLPGVHDWGSFGNTRPSFRVIQQYKALLVAGVEGSVACNLARPDGDGDCDMHCCASIKHSFFLRFFISKASLISIRRGEGYMPMFLSIPTAAWARPPLSHLWRLLASSVHAASREVSAARDTNGLTQKGGGTLAQERQGRE
jgi:hypothetical protein